MTEACDYQEVLVGLGLLSLTPVLRAVAASTDAQRAVVAAHRLGKAPAVRAVVRALLAGTETDVDAPPEGYRTIAALMGERVQRGELQLSPSQRPTVKAFLAAGVDIAYALPLLTRTRDAPVQATRTPFAPGWSIYVVASLFGWSGWSVLSEHTRNVLRVVGSSERTQRAVMAAHRLNGYAAVDAVLESLEVEDL